MFRNNDRLPEYHELSQRDGATFTPTQKASIYYYSCENGKYSYKSVNGLLRDPQHQLSSGESKEVLRRQIDALTDCLNGKSLDRQAKLYRGVKSLSDVLGEDISNCSPDEVAQKYTGVEYVDRSFTSATCSQAVAQKFADASLKKDPAIIQIRAPKGTNAAFIGSASSFGETEYEVLVQRNARFRIEKIKYMNQQYYVTLTLLGIFS